MGSLDLPVELRRARFDINMSDPLVFDVPVKVRLKFMSPIGSNRVNAERELLDHMIDEIDGAFLVVAQVDSESSDSCGIIDCGVLITTDLLSLRGVKKRNFTSTWI